MTLHDQTIIDWINEAAERLPVDAGAMPAPHKEAPVLETTAPNRSSKRRSRLLMAAACLALLLGGGLLVAWPGDDIVDLAARPILDAPAPVPDAAPTPGTRLPHVDDGPEWFGTAIPAERSGGDRSGRWTTAAIGIDGNPVRSPIAISASVGPLDGLTSAEIATIDGVTVRLLEFGSFTLMASTTEPTILVSGVAPPSVLLDVLAATSSVDTGDHLTLELASLPDGYTVVAQPQVHAVDPAGRNTLTNRAGDTTINEISDWINPELAAAATGADYGETTVGGRVAWTGRTDSSSYGPLTFLTWSPEPGVVIEITTANLDIDVEDLVLLAESTNIVDLDTWLSHYPNP